MTLSEPEQHHQTPSEAELHRQNPVAGQRADLWEGHTGHPGCGFCMSVDVIPPLAVQSSLHETDWQDQAIPSGTPRQDSGCLPTGQGMQRVLSLDQTTPICPALSHSVRLATQHKPLWSL